jgi:hypothetical protein
MKDLYHVLGLFLEILTYTETAAALGDREKFRGDETEETDLQPIGSVFDDVWVIKVLKSGKVCMKIRYGKGEPRISHQVLKH